MKNRENENTTFKGSRLREARLSMGLPVTGLAAAIGVTDATVHNYEKADRSPKPEIFAAICSVLRQPPLYFYRTNKDDDFSFDDVHFRARASLNELDKGRVKVRLKWASEYYRYLAEHLQLPKLNLPDLDISDDPTLTTEEQVEKAAITLRDLWGLEGSPISNLTAVAERNGIAIAHTNLELENLDGLSIWNKSQDRPFILLNTNKASCVRSRFDLAHEIGHMVLHKNVKSDIYKSAKVYKLMEKQANEFASALLLPESVWAEEVTAFSLAGFKTLKPRWKTSIAAMIMRGHKLEYIDNRQKVNLNKQISTMKWRKKEPFDDLWEVEKPRLFTQATEMLGNAGITGDIIASTIPHSKDFYVEVTNMPPSYFEKHNLLISEGQTLLN